MLVIQSLDVLSSLIKGQLPRGFSVWGRHNVWFCTPVNMKLWRDGCTQIVGSCPPRISAGELPVNQYIITAIWPQAGSIHPLLSFDVKIRHQKQNVAEARGHSGLQINFVAAPMSIIFACNGDFFPICFKVYCTVIVSQYDQ